MLAIFLKKNEVKKIQFLALVVQRGSLSLQEFMALTDLKRPTVDRLVNQLEEDLKILYPEENQLSLAQEKKYTLKGTLTEESKHPLSYLYDYYVSKSLTHQLLLLLIRQAKYTIEDLSDHLVSSTAYIYQLIRKLNRRLEIFGLKIINSDG